MNMTNYGLDFLITNFFHIMKIDFQANLHLILPFFAFSVIIHLTQNIKSYYLERGN